MSKQNTGTTDARALVQAERDTAKLYVATVASEAGIHFERVQIIGRAVAQGQSVRGIAAVIGEESARVAYPTASASDLVKIGAHAPHAVSKSTVDSYAQSASLLASAGVTQTAGSVSAAYKLATRSGSSSERADLAARTVKLEPVKREGFFVSESVVILKRMALAKKTASSSKSVPTAGPSKGGLPVETAAAEEVVSTPQSVEVLIQTLVDTLTELSARTLTQEETTAVLSVLAPYATASV